MSLVMLNRHSFPKVLYKFIKCNFYVKFGIYIENSHAFINKVIFAFIFRKDSCALITFYFRLRLVLSLKQKRSPPIIVNIIYIQSF